MFNSMQDAIKKMLIIMYNFIFRHKFITQSSVFVMFYISSTDIYNYMRMRSVVTCRTVCYRFQMINTLFLFLVFAMRYKPPDFILYYYLRMKNNANMVSLYFQVYGIPIDIISEIYC